MTEEAATLAERMAAELRVLGDLQREVAPAEAEISYRRALQLVPGAADAHMALATTLLRLNRLCEAAGHLARARVIDPAHEAASLLWAELLAAQGRVPEAIRSLEEAIERGAGAAHLVAFGDVLARIGLSKPAEAAYRVALELDDNAAGRVNLAVLLASRGRAAEALAEL